VKTSNLTLVLAHYNLDEKCVLSTGAIRKHFGVLVATVVLQCFAFNSIIHETVHIYESWAVHMLRFKVWKHELSLAVCVVLAINIISVVAAVWRQSNTTYTRMQLKAETESSSDT
jgi:hypothetical protein